MASGVYKPCLRALVASLSYDATAVIATIGTAIVLRQYWWWPLAAALPCLFALHSLWCTFTVMTEHVVVTDNHVGAVSPRATSLISWDDIADVLIRRRPRGMQFGRAERVVVISDSRQWRAVLNTSVLSEEDEREVLAAIRQRTRCPVREMTDG